MATTIVISQALRDALTQWNIEQVGRGCNWSRSLLRPDGRYDVEVAPDIIARLEMLRGPHESDEDVLWRVMGNPGTRSEH